MCFPSLGKIKFQAIKRTKEGEERKNKVNNLTKIKSEREKEKDKERKKKE